MAASRASSMPRSKGLGRERCMAITAPDFASARPLVAASETIVTMASLIVTHYAGAYTLYQFPPPLNLPSVDIAMASDPRSMVDAGVAWLAEQISNHADHLRAAWLLNVSRAAPP